MATVCIALPPPGAPPPPPPRAAPPRCRRGRLLCDAPRRIVARRVACRAPETGRRAGPVGPCVPWGRAAGGRPFRARVSGDPCRGARVAPRPRCLRDAAAPGRYGHPRRRGLLRARRVAAAARYERSEEHTSELQ